MTPHISVIIPAHNEEIHLPRCLESIRIAALRASATVEVIVVLNRCTDRTESIAREHGATTVVEPARNLARIRNTGIRSSHADNIVTIDADSWMSANMLQEVLRKLSMNRYVGGGVRIMPERMSLGIFFSTMTFAPRLILQGCWAGMFWMPRQAFDAVGGFNERLVSAEDVDFAKRLRSHGRSKGLRYGIITRAHIVTSCRKFDHFGDWYLVRNRRLVSRILSGQDQSAADLFYYDFRERQHNH